MNSSAFKTTCTVALLSVGSVAWLVAPAHATEAIALSFDLEGSASPPDLPDAGSNAQPDVGIGTTPTLTVPSASPQIQPLIIPNAAIAAPVGHAASAMELPPPPPAPTPLAPAGSVASSEPSLQVTNELVTDELARNESVTDEFGTDESAIAAAPSLNRLNDGTLSFELDVPRSAQLAIAPTPNVPVSTAANSPSLNPLFEGASHSLVAIAVGHAEGTRTATGEKTSAYNGHTDPGNGVWNMGTFSYQHGAATPEDADAKQLQRLKRQAHELTQMASERGLTLTLEETLNGIDLANQSPRAALSRGGYIDRLSEAKAMGLHGTEAVLWARTRSYLDPDTQQWNAPGLGNTVERITADQDRRIRAIARALQSQASAAQPKLSTDASLSTSAVFKLDLAPSW
ncbi:hypothetical protein ACQ4M4_18815 [Leptolyngbya sp. AN02str]|uniref:hypothetical protein n=1 Tax=Leptolyngbya sp. AN02str TaxID=3423363 RepID=UPI003D31B5D4